MFVSVIHSTIHCKNMVQLDPLDTWSYCSELSAANRLTPGEYCLVRPERVRPTQVFIGKVEMECTKRSIEKKNSSELKTFLIENFVPAVIGPDAEIYIIDHHHFAVALFQSFLDFKRPTIHRVLYACIQADYSNMSQQDFWKTMEHNRFVFLEDERGNTITVEQLPDTLKLMADNPYRTLASWLRKSNAYVKCGTKRTTDLPQCLGQTAPFFFGVLLGRLHEIEVSSR